MTYRITRRLLFMRNGQTHETIELHPGDVVQGVTLASASPSEQQALRKMEQRHDKQSQNERLVWVQVHGVVRGLVSVKDCVPSKRQATVPR